MKKTHSPLYLTGSLILASAFAFAACEKKAPTTSTPPKPAATDDHGHSHDDGHSHDAAPSHAPGHGGAVIALGEQVVGPFNTKATRDQGEIVAGKDAPIDVTVTPTGTAKAVAVRFWIGTQDAKGSVKAKADIEDPKDPNRWHTHAEIPNPIPEGSKIWVEIEDDAGAKHVAGFAFGS